MASLSTDGDGLVVTVAAPAFGLPSWSAESLAVLLYLQMSDIDAAVRPSAYPYSPATGPLPALRQGATAVGRRGALAFLRAHHGDLDRISGLTRAQCSDVEAYLAAVRETLEPAVQYLWWVPDKNYAALPWRHYAPAAAFPLDYVLPLEERRRVREDCEKRGLRSPEEALAQVRRVYGALSARLGASRHFFGERPSSLDAVVAAHVAVHLHSPLAEPKGALASVILNEFPELERHCRDVLFRYCPGYHPPTGGTYVAERVREAEARAAAARGDAGPAADADGEAPAEDDAEKEAARRRSTVQSSLFVGGALLAMGLYRAVAASSRAVPQ